MTTLQITVMKPSLKLWKIFPVSPPALNTIARAYRLDFTFWASWTWEEGYLFDSSHCVCLLFSRIGLNFFHHGLLWGLRLWVPLEQYKCWVQYCSAIDGQNVSVFENCHSWFLLILACYSIWLPSVSYLQPWRIWQQNQKK